VSMTRYFSDYADLCFEVFGDRVKHWLTFSDPRVSRASSSYGETGRYPAVSRDPGVPIAVSADNGRKRL
jgi:beta-glucosidase/6-phospho-beta-glucosidase/beta-galactosidase